MSLLFILFLAHQLGHAIMRHDSEQLYFRPGTTKMVLLVSLPCKFVCYKELTVWAEETRVCCLSFCEALLFPYPRPRRLIASVLLWWLRHNMTREMGWENFTITVQSGMNFVQYNFM